MTTSIKTCAGEPWKRIPSLPGYFARADGVLMRAANHKRMPHGGMRLYGAQETRGQWTGKRFIIRAGGKTHKVARLICEAFSGPAPTGHVCMHLDEDASNNAASNLRWGTQKENLNFPGFIQYCKGRTGDNNPNIKGKKIREASAGPA